MKKLFIMGVMLAFVGYAGMAMAQGRGAPISYKKFAVFSPSLFNSTLLNSGSTQNQAQQQRTAAPAALRSYILKFEPGSIELSEAQKIQLLDTLRRVTARNIRTIDLTSASDNWNISQQRLSTVLLFLSANEDPQRPFKYTARSIPPESVVGNAMNTVRVVEMNK